MDYQRIYDELITYRHENVITSGYSEKHHVKMRSLGGLDDESNLVRLTGREHYVAHLLLARFNKCSQTAHALWMMQCRSRSHEDRPYIKSSRMYEWARKEFSKYISRSAKITSKGERNSQHGTRWICNIDLQENRKISKTNELLQGWILGRNKWVVKPKSNKIEERKNFITLTWTMLYEEWVSSGISIDMFAKSKGYAGASSATKMWSRLGLYKQQKQIGR